MRLAEADLAGGTYNRFLPVYVERTKKIPWPPQPDREQLAGLGNRLRSALAKARCWPIPVQP
jgi:hypothetical protein